MSAVKFGVLPQRLMSILQAATLLEVADNEAVVCESVWKGGLITETCDIALAQTKHHVTKPLFCVKNVETDS
eukprot:959529-Amphidinium_carterae.1